MKEFSIEEKAKRSDEAIKKAKSKIKDDKDHVLYEDDVIEIFPELKESEKSKKWILEYLYDGLRKSDEQFKDQFKAAIAWFEEQGEQKPVEWSEEDENLLKLSLENLTELKDRFGEDYGRVGDCISWFKSLKERVQFQPQWKPSAEQLYTLEKATHIVGSKYKSCLNSLYSDLKKLREE